MYAYITGKLAMKLTNSIVLENNGIGYKIYMAQNAMDALGNVGDDVKVYTHYHVREDNISLYGFLSNEALNMFETLITVSGIGAKSALTILANIEPQEFAVSVINEDEARLTKIPGLGKKTVARMIIELKDKLNKLDLDGLPTDSTGAYAVPHMTANMLDAISALQVLGYNRREIEKTLAEQDLTNKSVEQIIKIGLTMLSKK